MPCSPFKQPAFLAGYASTRIDDDRLKEVLHRAFKARLQEIMDQSQHASSATASASSGVGNVDMQAELFLQGMDEWEKERECFLFILFFGIPVFDQSLPSSQKQPPFGTWGGGTCPRETLVPDYEI